MKRFIMSFVLIVSAVLLFGEEGADHPTIGRFSGAEIRHQEYSEFGSYNFPVGETDAEQISGRTWMTLYDAPADASTFGIYTTYRDFLMESGYEIVVDFPPESYPDMRDAYERAGFADNGNYDYSGAITNGDGAYNAVLSARKTDMVPATYICIAIASGWRSFPQYKLDIVEIGGNTAGLVSIGSEPSAAASAEESSGAPADSDAADVSDTSGGSDKAGGTGIRKTPLLTGDGGFRIRSGISALLFMDPSIAGSLTLEDDNGTTTVDADGFKNLSGPFVEAMWFPNANLGFGFDFTYLISGDGISDGGDYYRTESDIQLYRIVVAARLVGADYPVSLNMSISGGLAVVNLVITEDTGPEYLYECEDLLPAIGISMDMTVPIYRWFQFTGGLEYLYVPFSELTFERNSGTPYSTTQYWGSLGGLSLRLGLVGSF